MTADASLTRVLVMVNDKLRRSLNLKISYWLFDHYDLFCKK